MVQTRAAKLAKGHAVSVADGTLLAISTTTVRWRVPLARTMIKGRQGSHYIGAEAGLCQYHPWQLLLHGFLTTTTTSSKKGSKGASGGASD